jgi:hypothetical protein
MLVTVEKNKLYKKQQRASTNDLSQKILELSIKDVKIREGYNRVLSSSNLSFYIKKAFLTQKSNQVDNFNILKPEKLVLPNEASMGVAVEGSEDFFPNNGVNETDISSASSSRISGDGSESVTIGSGSNGPIYCSRACFAARRRSRHRRVVVVISQATGDWMPVPAELCQRSQASCNTSSASAREPSMR